MINLVQNFAAGCLEGSKFGVPTWYRYVNGVDNAGKCSPDIDFSSNLQGGVIAILLGVFDIILFLGGIMAVGFVIVGAFQYIIAQGEPERAKNARSTIINALIGLVIVLFSTAIVRLIGNNL